MTVILQIHWEGVTPKQYDDLGKKANWYGDPPEGGIFHAAWFESDGLHVVDVWESREHFHRFFDNQVLPHLSGDMPRNRPSLEFRPLHAMSNDEAKRVKRSA